MRISQLRDFVSIVEAGSIRAAARTHGVSHPAMSKSLRALEGEVGVQLIRRSTRGVVCTPAGRAFLAHAGAIRAEVRKAEEELAELAAPGGGTVSVGFTPTVAAVAPEAIARFLDDHPLVRLRIMEGTASALVPLVRDETLDFAVVQKILATVGPGLKFRALYRDRMVIACRRGHSLRGARFLSELADTRWLGFIAPGSGSWLERAFATVGLAFPRRFTMCESFAFAVELMTRTDAVMAMPAPVFAGPLSRGLLAEIPVEEPLPPYVLGLCTRAETQMTSLATVLARAVADLTRRLPQAR
jgi:LysR family transcriptional regulator of abg operon